MPSDFHNHLTLEPEKSPQLQTGLEAFLIRENQDSLKKNPEPLAFILQNDPTAYQTMVDILGEDMAREIQSKQPPQNEKNPDNYSEDPTTAKIQVAIYENLGIDVNTDNNGFLKKLMKGCIDGLIIGNIELIAQIQKEGLQKFLGQVASQFSSTDGWKKIFSKIGDDIGNVFSLDAYKTGKTGSEYIGIIGGAGLAGWALKKGGKVAVETGIKVAIKAEGKTLVSSALESTGKGMIKTGESLQVPYKAVEKVTDGAMNLAGKGLKAGTEALNKVPGVQKIATAVKSNVARIVVGEGVRIVGSRDTPAALRYQIGAAGGDVSKVKPFEKVEGKPIMEDMKVPTEEVNPSELKVEKKELGFDIANNPVYKEFSFLEKYADVLGDLKPSDIISDIGTQGLIVKPEKLKGVIAKIERPGSVDRVVDEFNLHIQAYDIWKEGKKSGAISENIFVPKVQMPNGIDGGIILIEQIPGQSLHTKSLIENAYKMRKDAQPLTQIEKDVVGELTDGEAKKWIMEKYDMSADDAFRVIELYSVDHLRPYLYDRMQPTFRTDLTRALAYLQSQSPGINHIDIHPGNIMVTKDGKIYIIDWGRAKITNVPNPINP